MSLRSSFCLSPTTIVEESLVQRKSRSPTSGFCGYRFTFCWIFRYVSFRTDEENDDAGKVPCFNVAKLEEAKFLKQ
jgi:hypothetical protein